MLLFSMVRKNGPDESLVNRAMRSEEAFSFLASEMFWGPTVLEEGPHRVRICTTIFGCMDTTTWTGSAEEMADLTALARLVNRRMPARIAVFEALGYRPTESEVMLIAEKKVELDDLIAGVYLARDEGETLHNIL